MRHQRIIHVISLTLMLVWQSVSLSDSYNIAVNGIFKDKAVLLVNGKRHILSLGNKTPEGVALIAIAGEKVTLQFNDQQHVYTLGETTGISTSFKQNKQKEVIVSLDSHGQFNTVGMINNQTVDFLVDTGATAIALNKNTAEQLGIDYLHTGNPAVVSTASGTSEAYVVVLDSVIVGEIELKNVQAVVINGDFPSKVLLGMSFLGNLELHREGQILKITKNW